MLRWRHEVERRGNGAAGRPETEADAAVRGRDQRRSEMIENASHFLQEDAGEEIGERIAKWIQL